jgi:alpha-N-arabinofuranosidase
MMKVAARQMAGLALHYYCGTGLKSRSATKFDEGDWFHQLRSALRMEDLVSKHAEIMDKYDPKKLVALVVDEWGAWHAVEPGTNPGFLYQQNTLRDALVAGITLNIFNRHCDRVRMANIAQTVNVLQAMILTDKEKMIVTPTYHVFDMYQVHQDARMLPVELQTADYEGQGETIAGTSPGPKTRGVRLQLGPAAIPGLSVSASRDKAGTIHVSICNLNPNAPAELTCQLLGAKPSAISGRVLTAPTITAHNTFDSPQAIAPDEFTGAKLIDGGFTATLPAKSVVVLELK